MKKIVFKRIAPYLKVLAITLLLCYCILLLKSYINIRKSKYNFARIPYHTGLIEQTNSVFCSMNMAKKTLFSFDNYLFIKENFSNGQDVYAQIDDNGKHIKNFTIFDNSLGIAGYTDSCIYWVSDCQLKYRKNNENICRTIHYQKKIINAIAIDGDNRFLIIDVDTITSYSRTSFSICNKIGNSLNQINTVSIQLPHRYKTFPEKVLAYSGSFLKSFDCITYTFSHIPFVYVFDNLGNFIAAIKTNDNVPLPSIVKYKNFYIFERGKSFNSNISSFVYNNTVCIFPYHSTYNKGFTIDCYSLTDGIYKGSLYIGNKDGRKVYNSMIDEIASTSKYILINSNGKLITLRCGN